MYSQQGTVPQFPSLSPLRYIAQVGVSCETGKEKQWGKYEERG